MHIQISFEDVAGEKAEMLIAMLSTIGFDGFEEEGNQLLAYIPANEFDESSLTETISSIDVKYSKTKIKETNWNEVWESNFPPVVVDDFVSVLADFHQPVAGVEKEIRITPKMSFGTGHHATTFMMMQQMRKIDFNGKTVLDFGTGTGVLAILAEMLGAEKVIALDNDDWSINNAQENLERNHCSKIELEKADNAVRPEKFDVILANINRHIILENLQVLVDQVRAGGLVLFSGLLVTDRTEILQQAEAAGLVLVDSGELRNWLVLRMSKA